MSAHLYPAPVDMPGRNEKENPLWLSRSGFLAS